MGILDEVQNKRTEGLTPSPYMSHPSRRGLVQQQPLDFICSSKQVGLSNLLAFLIKF